MWSKHFTINVTGKPYNTRIGKNWVFDTFKIIVRAIVYRYMQAKNQSVSLLKKSSRHKETNAQERTCWIISLKTPSDQHDKEQDFI